MERGRRRGPVNEEVQVRVKALKLTGRKHFVLRYVDPATGRTREEATEIKALDRNRRRAMQAASTREGELQKIVDSGAVVARPRPAGRLTVDQLIAKHLKWVEVSRSVSLHSQRQSLLKGFAAHVVTEQEDDDELIGVGARVGELLAKVATPAHVAQYIDSKQGQPGGSPVTLRSIRIAIKATWNWASDTGLLPVEFRPMAAMRRGRAPARDLTEADLPTPAEIEAVLRWSEVATSKLRAGTGRWRERRPDEYYGSVESRSFGDMMVVYHATGARTSELCDAVVRDFMPSTKQICLGKHKRTTTQTNPTIRNIQLGAKALAAVRRNVEGKGPGDPLFTRESGDRWVQNDVNRRFREVRKLAAKKEQKIRDHITPYSFRHLYISELLMIGTPVFQVAKMAGTSASEIEKTYGHFYNRDLAAAQSKLDRRRARVKQGEDKGESPLHPGKG